MRAFSSPPHNQRQDIRPLKADEEKSVVRKSSQSVVPPRSFHIPGLTPRAFADARERLRSRRGALREAFAGAVPVIDWAEPDDPDRLPQERAARWFGASLAFYVSQGESVRQGWPPGLPLSIAGSSVSDTAKQMMIVIGHDACDPRRPGSCLQVQHTSPPPLRISQRPWANPTSFNTTPGRPRLLCLKSQGGGDFLFNEGRYMAARPEAHGGRTSPWRRNGKPKKSAASVSRGSNVPLREVSGYCSSAGGKRSDVSDRGRRR